jgi:hypothetical protein
MIPNCVSGTNTPAWRTASKGDVSGDESDEAVEEFMDLTWAMASLYYMGLT